jgi:hypothetical protein
LAPAFQKHFLILYQLSVCLYVSSPPVCLSIRLPFESGMLHPSVCPYVCPFKSGMIHPSVYQYACPFEIRDGPLTQGGERMAECPDTVAFLEVLATLDAVPDDRQTDIDSSPDDGDATEDLPERRAARGLFRWEARAHAPTVPRVLPLCFHPSDGRRPRMPPTSENFAIVLPSFTWEVPTHAPTVPRVLPLLWVWGASSVY